MIKLQFKKTHFASELISINGPLSVSNIVGNYTIVVAIGTQTEQKNMFSAGLIYFALRYCFGLLKILCNNTCKRLVSWILWWQFAVESGYHLKWPSLKQLPLSHIPSTVICYLLDFGRYFHCQEIESYCHTLLSSTKVWRNPIKLLSKHTCP